MCPFRDSPVPPSHPARAMPRGKAARALHETGHYWKTTLFFVLVFVAFMVIAHFWPTR